MSILLSHSPAVIIKHLLVNFGVASLPGAYNDWPVTDAHEADKPDNAITVYHTSGQVSDGRFQVNGEVQEDYGIMIRVRAVTDAIGSAKLNAIIGILNQSVNRTPVTVEGVLYTVHSASFASRTQLGTGQDNSEREVFTTNYLMAISQESGT
jgi:hypothetical protein